jgi:hypothetical protein
MASRLCIAERNVVGKHTLGQRTHACGSAAPRAVQRRASRGGDACSAVRTKKAPTFVQSAQ